MNAPSTTEFAAFIGIDWADRKHDVCLAAPDASASECSVIDHRPTAIRNWARRISAWHRGTEPTRLPPDAVRVAPRMRVAAAAGRDVFCYFDNTDVKLRAPKDARSLMRELGVIAPVSSRSPAPTSRRRAPDRALRKRGARRA